MLCSFQRLAGLKQGDFYHWVDLLNHFEVFFEKYLKPRKDLQLEGEFLEGDSPFPKEAVLQVLRVTRIILENCMNKYLYSSNEVLLHYHNACFRECNLVLLSLCTNQSILAVSRL